MTSSPFALGKLANYRDLGGLAGAHGTIRPGVLFRADDVSTIDADEAARIADTGLALIIDLRSTDELAAGRGPLADHDIDYLNLPIMQHSGSTQSLGAVLESGGFTNDMLGQWYYSVLLRSMPMLVQGLEAIVAADGPVLFHCAIGKDRTGLFALALHGALGTHRDEIVSDYARSGANLAHLHARLASSQPMWTPEVIERAGALLRADAEAMLALLDAIDADGATLDALLVTGGADEHLFEQLRTWALVSPEEAPQHR